MNRLKLKSVLVAVLLSVALMGGNVFSAPGGTFVQKTAPGSYDATISALKRAVASNGMMIAGEIDQKQILSMAGLNLEGVHSFFVGNPVVGKKLFEMNPAAGAVVPLRFLVWVDRAGKTHVGYFKPSERLTAIDPMFKKPGQMLDKKFGMILNAATR